MQHSVNILCIYNVMYTSVYCVILQAMYSVTVVYIQLFVHVHVRVHAQLNCTCTCIYIVGE